MTWKSRREELASETASRREAEVRGHENVGVVCGVNFASDSGMVAGRSGVFENSAVIWINPEETEDGRVESRGGGSEVVDNKCVPLICVTEAK